TQAESAQVTPFCNNGKKLLDCQHECGGGPIQCTVDVPGNAVDACTQSFTKDGAMYASVSDYCSKIYNSSPWRDCKPLGGINYDTSQDSFTGGYSPRPIASGLDTSG